MASKKEDKALPDAPETEASDVKVVEDDKLDIEDIKDPAETLEEPEEDNESEIDLEELVEEKVEPQTSEPAPKYPVSEKKKEKKSFFTRKSKPKKIKAEKEPKQNVSQEEKKQKSGLATAVTIILTIIITTAVVLGAVFAYTKFVKPKTTDAPAKEEKVEAQDQVAADKFVWVNHAAGLNLRKEPTTVAEILAIIPNGTKLLVLDEDAGWYKVEYESKEGWVSKDYVTEKNPLLYESLIYGFSLDFPEAWAGYKVVEKTTEWGSFSAKTLYVALPYTDKNWIQSEDTPKGYASLFAITPFTLKQWSQVDESDKTKMTKLNQSASFVYTWTEGQAYPEDFAGKIGAINDIIKSFKLVN